jgi:ABC-type transport system involved in multi-copper enzyme maturation permease subunit
MMQPAMILAIARAEMRSTRRLVRYWVFAVLSVLIASVMFFQMAFMHGMFSRHSATVGAMGPRFLIAAVGIYLLIVFLIGLIFLAFDVRARDERERMAEVLDSRPISNSEFLLGRCLGLVFMSWLPVLFVAALLQVFGLLSLWNDWPIGEPLEPYSVMGFLLQTLTTLALWCSIIVLVAVGVRNRLVIALVALGLLGFQFWLTFQLPVYLAPVFTILPAFDMASDLTPTLFPPDQGAGIHFLALWILTAGFVTLAIALHPRSDGGLTSRRLALGGAFVVLSIAMIGAQLWQANDNLAQGAAVLAAHQEHSKAARADIVAIDGTVRIDPGDALDLDLDLRVRTPSGSPRVEQLIFTFNPGLAVQSVSVDGVAAPWTHASGLLKISPSRPLMKDAEMVIALAASGLPDTTFGYLDSSFDLLKGDAMDAQVGVLGFDISIFTSGYVALMPGSRWLPRAGSDVPSGDPRTHPDDYFEVDLEVEAPADWLVAGPGRRQAVSEDDDAVRVRFHPVAPVSEVGLFASHFARRSLQVAGVEFEMLVYPGHDRNLDFFADAGEALEGRLEELFTEAKKLGLPYPYESLSLVEVPNRLRGYGGGWRMDTVQTMPGVLLLRETSFPTSRFEMGFQEEEDFADEEGGIGAAKVAAIERFFENDFSGGNVFTGVSRNFLRFQTGAQGEGSLAINFVLDELVSQLLTGKRGYFSAHEFSQQANLLIGQTMTDMATGRTDSIAEAVTSATTDQPSVWDRALGASLADLEPNEDPKQSLNVLALKSAAIARSILDGIGREKSAALLAEILSRYRGGNFDAHDLQNVALQLDVQLDPLLGDWLHDAALPGFLASSVKVDRLADDMGDPRYQTRVHVRNDEPVPGLVRVRYTTHGQALKAGEEKLWQQTEPLRIGGHQSREICIVSSAPPTEMWLQPYLALNRSDLQLALPKVDTKASVDAEPFLGARPSNWLPEQTSDIVIDDLDPGFSVQTEARMDGRVGGLAGLGGLKVDLDQGLPAFAAMFGPPQVWSRAEEFNGFGKYRRTHAIIASGDGNQRITFAAELPAPGSWRLAYYVSKKPTSRAAPGLAKVLNTMGKYNLTLSSGDGEEQQIEFDGAAAEDGWNDLGEFQLPAGETRLEVTNASSGRVVIADAIRWRRVSQGS